MSAGGWTALTSPLVRVITAQRIHTVSRETRPVALVSAPISAVPSSARVPPKITLPTPAASRPYIHLLVANETTSSETTSGTADRPAVSATLSLNPPAPKLRLPVRTFAVCGTTQRVTAHKSTVDSHFREPGSPRTRQPKDAESCWQSALGRTSYGPIGIPDRPPFHVKQPPCRIASEPHHHVRRPQQASPQGEPKRPAPEPSPVCSGVDALEPKELPYGPHAWLDTWPERSSLYTADLR